jgi:hypothetical protein
MERFLACTICTKHGPSPKACWPVYSSSLTPARRFHSAWMGVIVHTTQSIAFAAIALAIVSS